MNILNRKLGLLENLFEILHDLGGMIDVNVARIEGELVPEILRNALDLVQKRHPMLQVHIVDSEDGNYFQSEGTLKIPLRVIKNNYDNQWIDIAEEELHKKFPGGKETLCRVTFIRGCKNSEIIATFHHAITDGISCMYFIDNLLSYYHQINASEPISEIITMQMLPPIEKLLNSSFTSKNNFELSEKISNQEIHTSHLIIPSEPLSNNRRTCLVPRILSQEMTSNLINRCKQEQTTVHGALCAVMLFAAAEIVFTDNPITLSCGSSVNVRKLCEPKVSDKYLGDFALAIKENHTLEPNKDFWDLARECKSKISSSISCGFDIIYKLQKIDKDSIIKISDYQMGRTENIHISNIGKIDFLNQYGNLKIKNLYFVPGVHLIGSYLWLGVVTFHGQIFCTFAHVVPILSSKTVELVADFVVDTIQKVCL